MLGRLKSIHVMLTFVLLCFTLPRAVQSSLNRQLLNPRTPTRIQHSTTTIQSQLPVAFVPRGGGRYDQSDYDDNFDEYDEYDAKPAAPSRSRRPPPRPHRPDPRDKYRSNGRGRPPQRRPKRAKPKSDVLEQAKNLGQKSFQIATSATTSTLKSGGKAAYYLTAPKFVSRKEVCGIWRLDQSIGSTACAANIEFTSNGDAITKYHGEENVNGYLFQSRSWPRSCTIEFQAEAFQGPEDDFPVRYVYKGSFRRKIADKNVIKIVGKIYEVKKRFGRGDGRGVEVGSFVARRRITAADRNQSEDYDDYDDYDEEYDDDYDDYDDDYDEEEFGNRD